MKTLLETTLPAPLDDLDPRQYIIIKGARVNNLKNLSVAIPRNKLVVITGLSGSGKSSLAFDTLFAEGQRMYVESLSSYARQFLGRMDKPDVDYIRGVAPAIAIEQKVNSRNPRSTVGTTTEIYDYMKLLYARIGKTISPVSGAEVKKDTVDGVVDYAMALAEGQRLMVLYPLLVKEGRTVADELKILLQKGFTRIFLNEEVVFIEEWLEANAEKKASENKSEAILVVVDRVSIKHDEDTQFRLSDSVQTAFFEGEGTCKIWMEGKPTRTFSDRFEADGILFEEPSVNFFSFNNPYGACKHCEGFGTVLGIDPELVIPDKSQSVYEGAIAPWRGESFREEFLKPLLKNGIKFDFPIHRPWFELAPQEQELLWTGNEHFTGLNEFFEFLSSNSYKIQYRVMLSRFRGRTVCPECKGTRLRKDAGYVKISSKSIIELMLLPVSKLLPFFQKLVIAPQEQKIAKQLLEEINNRLGYLEKVGLGYLSLNRLTNSLSGGEFQRIKLATSLGSALVGSMYILDEPSIGLHPRDTQRLIEVLKTLRDLGNTVIVVEHEEEVMLAADQLIDIGPEAGEGGGHLIFQGKFEENGKAVKTLSDAENNSYTFKYLNKLEAIARPKPRTQFIDFITLVGARENNLKNLRVNIPLNAFTVVTGVSGSGKSTLISKVLYPALAHLQGVGTGESGKFDKLEGAYKKIKQVEFIDQNPIGKSSRSNPVSYVKALDAIRNLMASQVLAKNRGYSPSHFSFNVEGGRCETCQGEGEIKIEMQFMADIFLKCESCHGRRFKEEVLEVTFKEKNVAEILNLTVDDAIKFFGVQPKIAERLQPLADVGLGYVRLGQSSNTLSGGEAQRVKLAFFLSKANPIDNGMLFIFDEPTTGLHFHDISKLLKSIQALVNRGNTVIVIEHNLDMVKCADWMIDLGPEGGDAGGNLVFQGTVDEILEVKESITARYLKEKLAHA